MGVPINSLLTAALTVSGQNLDPALSPTTISLTAPTVQYNSNAVFQYGTISHGGNVASTLFSATFCPFLYVRNCTPVGNAILILTITPTGGVAQPINIFRGGIFLYANSNPSIGISVGTSLSEAQFNADTPNGLVVIEFLFGTQQ